MTTAINDENPWNLNDWTVLFDGTHTFNEPTNTSHIKRILGCGYEYSYQSTEEDDENDNGVWRNDLFYDGLKTHLKTYLKKLRNGIMSNRPHLHKKKKYGRAIYDRSLSLGVLPRRVRHTIAEEDWIDIDLDNAHPNILLQLCEYYNKEFEDDDFNETNYENLKEYCLNREYNLERLVKKYFDTDKQDPNYKHYRSQVKTLVLITFYLGSQRNWRKKLNIKESIGDDKLLSAIKNEITNITHSFIIPQNEELYKIIQTEHKRKRTEALKNKKNFTKNQISTIASVFLQHYERVIVEFAILDLVERNIIENLNVVYCYDGFMIRKTAYEKFMKEYDTTLTTHLQKVISKKTIFNLKWSIKTMDEGIWDEIHAYEESLNKEYTHPSDKLDVFDWNYFNINCENYSMKKDYFEHFVSCVKKHNQFFIIQNEYYIDCRNNTKGKKRVITSHEDVNLKKIFREFGSGEYNQHGTEIKFIEKWLDDANKRMYQTINFYPQNNPYHKLNGDEHILNTFTGYNPLLWETTYDRNKRDKIIHPFMEVGKGVLGSADDFMVFIHLMSHLIKYPSRKMPYTAVIKGIEGEGKNVILSVFASIIGEEHYITTSNIDDILGTHAEGVYHRLLVNLNEMELGSTSKQTNRIKSAVSEDKIVLNAKHQRPETIDNFAFIVITSNESVPVKIDIIADDRRYFVFQGNGKNKATYKQKHWSALVKHFEKPVFIKAFYDYLMELDVDNYDFKKAKYDNSLRPPYKNLIAHFVPMEALFLNDTILNQSLWLSCDLDDEDIDDFPPVGLFCGSEDFTKKQTIRVQRMISLFRRWAEENKFRQVAQEKNSKAFVNKIVNLGFKSIKKITDAVNYVCFEFVPADLYIELFERKFIDINTSLDWYTEYITKNKVVNPVDEVDISSLIPYSIADE